MKNSQAEKLLRRYTQKLATQAGVDNTKEQFSLTEPMEMQLADAILHKSSFLEMIHAIDVDQVQGQVVTVGDNLLATGRVQNGRFAQGSTIAGNDYKLVEMDSCGFITWAMLSTWGNSGSENEFFNKLNDNLLKRIALDTLRIGWHGQFEAPTTDPSTYKNGEDITKGWHQIAKDWNGGSQVITTPIKLGTGGDYNTLDSMGSDLVNSLPVELRDDPEIVILVGSDLVAREQMRLYDQADKPTESLAAKLLTTSIAGKPTYIPPFMPGKRMVATTLKNLHVYTQKGTRRRAAEDVQDRKRFENKYWRMQGYALGMPELYVAIDESAVSFI